MMELKLAEMEEPTPAPKGSLRWNARQLIDRGELGHIKELADRLDGKVPQGIEGSESGDPVQILFGAADKALCYGGKDEE